MATKKRSLSGQEENSLRSILQAAAIAALMDSRRWEPGDIAFQGGTSLHLAHGSARFSEDLDFMVKGGLSMEGLSKEVHKKLQLPRGIAQDLNISVTPGKDGRNPHMFYLVLSGPNVIGSVRVKIELWQTQEVALKSLDLVVSKVSSSMGQAFVPTLTLTEIFADKVYALGARNRIKARDVFDLWWLCEKETPEITNASLRTRLDIYPCESGNPAETAAIWLDNAEKRLQDLLSVNANEFISEDLKKWLPTSWKMNHDAASEMVKVSVDHLNHGILMMKEVVLNLEAESKTIDRTYRDI